MISYEIALDVAIIGVIKVYGTIDLAEPVRVDVLDLTVTEGSYLIGSCDRFL